MKKLIYIPVVIAAIHFFSPQATASSGHLPKYDVNTFCKRVGDHSGGSSVIINRCIQQEQIAYDTLKHQWSHIDIKVKRFCNKVGNSAGGSYEILDSCVKQAIAEKSQQHAFQY